MDLAHEIISKNECSALVSQIDANSNDEFMYYFFDVKKEVRLLKTVEK